MTATETTPELVDTPFCYESNLRLPVDSIVANPANPRKDATPDDILIESIKQQGLIEPLVVRPLPQVNGDAQRFELLAGHRRLAAVKAAGFTRVPCVYRHTDEAGALEIILVENMARKDLAPLEEAAGIAGLTGLGRSQRDVAKLLGVSQSHVSKRLALLKLPAPALEAVEKGRDAGGITIEEGLALVGLPAKTVGELFKKGTPQTWAVTDAVRNHEMEQKRAKVVADLEKAGVTIVEGSPGWNRAHPPCRLFGLEGFRSDEAQKAHEGEPCHAVHVDRYGRPEACCTDPARHPEEVDDDDEDEEESDETYVSGKGWVPIAGLTDEERATIEKDRAERAEADRRAEQHKIDRERRREHCRGLVAKAPIPQRYPEVFGLAAMILPCMSDVALTGVCDLLSLHKETEDLDTWEEMVGVAQTFALSADHGSIRLVYAMALDLGNDLIRWHGTTDSDQESAAAKAYLAHLRDTRYELSDYEREIVDGPTPEDTATDGTVTEDAATEGPVVTVVQKGKRWVVTCSDPECGKLGPGNTTEAYGQLAGVNHLHSKHGITTTPASITTT